MDVVVFGGEVQLIKAIIGTAKNLYERYHSIQKVSPNKPKRGKSGYPVRSCLRGANYHNERGVH